MTVVLASVLAGCAAAVLALRAPPRRLSRVLVDGARPEPGQREPGRQGRRPAAPGPRAACLVAAVALVVLLPGPVGVGLAALVVVAGPRVLGRLEPAAARRERERLRADVPLVLDLLAACLAGGASLPAAAHTVGRAVPGPAGDRLRAVADALEVGTAPGSAWSALAAGRDDDVLAPAARALRRACDGGAPVAEAVARLAADARADARAAGEEAARRAGVLAVAPLGLCFLPAFVLLGVVPVVVGLATPLLSGS